MSQENKVMGIVGAVVGSVLGLIVWCLIGAAGYISWIGGLALAAGAFGGYKLLGKNIGGVGIVVCAVLVIAIVYVGTRMNYALQLHKDFQENDDVVFVTEMMGLDSEASTFEIFNDFGEYCDAYDELYELVGEDSSYSDEFKKDLIFGYVITAIVSVAIVVRLKKM